MPTVVIGTAGHIDHGKTALLRALTGIDADRLPEEKARGMTLDVGYAHLAFDDGVELDFVDVPGHDRLIGNMLVGAGEIDVAMLVVAADDGPRPQTLEHLQLLDALGIRDGVAVITKIDLVDAARLAEVTEAVRALLRPTWLGGVPILAASSVTGEGTGELRLALRAVSEGVALPAGPPRLAVDRVFVAKGRGVVVTGTLRGGAIRAGQSLRREPGGEVIRVREIQVHGTPREAHDGGRTALNIVGLDAGVLRRGDVLTAGDWVTGSDRLLVRRSGDASLAQPRTWPPRQGARVRLHAGTDQVEARVGRIRGVDDEVLLDLDRRMAAAPGDRAILREPGSGAIAGGAVVLDARPPRGVSRRRMTPDRLVALANAVETGDPSAIEAARLDLHGVAGTDFAADLTAALGSAATEAVTAHHAASPLSAGLPLPRARAALLRRLRSLATVERSNADAAATGIARLLDDLVAERRLARHGDALRDPALATEALPAQLLAAMERLESALAVAAPPPLADAAAAAGCPPDGIRALLAAGRIVRVDADLAWATPTYHGLAALALELARAAPVTPAALRDATGTSRKYVLAILEDLDRRGILQRTPEGHVPGSRAPRASTPAPVA